MPRAQLLGHEVTEGVTYGEPGEGGEDREASAPNELKVAKGLTRDGELLEVYQKL